MRVTSSRKWLWLGALALLAVGAIIYRSSLEIGFWSDDYGFFEMAGRLSLPQYLIYYFDPRVQIHWYRPLHAMMWWLGYMVFGQNIAGYHLLQILVHLANCLLLYALVVRATHRIRLAFLAALIYLTLPVYALAVYWPAVADPLAALFFLLALWFWLDYLAVGGTFRYVLTVLAVIAALLTKEINVMLPIVLVLADWWLMGDKSIIPALSRGTVIGTIKRYGLFFALVPIYALLEFPALAQGVFTQYLGYRVGGNVWDALVLHSARLVFPWGAEPPWDLLCLVLVLALLGFALYRRVLPILFIAVAALLLVLPVLPLPVAIARAPRYLYIPLMASAIGYGAMADWILRALRAPTRLVAFAGALALSILMTWGSAGIDEQAVNFAGSTRQARLDFRPIFQRHPTVEPDTLFYFIQSPMLTPDLSGLMFQRYGPNVRVYGNDRDGKANLRQHNVAYICYRDEQDVWHEQLVAQSAPALNVPTHFGQSVSLEGWELASANMKQDEAVILLVYWRTAQLIARNYTVFTHLVSTRGDIVGGYDGTPRSGDAPTTRWRVGDLISDGIVIPVDASVAPGEYHIELGLYDTATMQRLAVLDAGGNPVDDKIVIGPIRVGE